MANQVVRFSSTEFRVYRDGKYTGEHYQTRAEAVAAAESPTPASSQRPAQAAAAPSRPSAAVQPAHRSEPAAQTDAWFVVTNQYEMKGGGFVYAGPTPQEENYSNPVNVLVLTVVEGPMGQKEALRRTEELSAAAWQKQAEEAVSYEEYKQGQTMPSATRNERKAMHMDNYQTGVKNGFLLEKYLAVPWTALREELADASDPSYLQEVANRYLAYRNAAMQANKSLYSRPPTYTPVRTRFSKYAAIAKPHGNQHQPVDVLIPLARGEEDIFHRVDHYSTYRERIGKAMKRSWGDYVWWTTGENNRSFLKGVPDFQDWWEAHHVRKNPNTMIPLPYPTSDYEWGHAQPLANWTSYPEYSYQQFARSNGRARANGKKLAPSPTIGIPTPYRMPENAGPYLPRIFPYGPKGRPATYEIAKENRRGYGPGEREHLPTSAFLKPETRSWPVSDKDHAFIALQYMTRGFGNRSEYPKLIQRLAQIWPPSGHPDVWAWYDAHREQIEQKAGRAMPRIGRENGRTVRRGKPGQPKPYFYMSSSELKQAIASGDAGAQGEAQRRGWVGGEPTYTIGGRK